MIAWKVNGVWQGFAGCPHQEVVEAIILAIPLICVPLFETQALLWKPLEGVTKTTRTVCTLIGCHQEVNADVWHSEPILGLSKVGWEISGKKIFS
jgi:hypothetical protein